MPHVVLSGKPDLEQFWRTYRRIDIRTPEGTVLRTGECWLNEQKLSVMLECRAMEFGIMRTFYVLVTDQNGRCSVHLERLTAPPSPLPACVQILMGLIATELLRRFPNLVLSNTDLPPELLTAGCPDSLPSKGNS